MKPSLMLLMTTVLWGFWGYAEKQAVLRAHPFTVQWMYTVPLVLMLPVFYFLGRSYDPARNLSTGAFVWAAAAAVLGLTAALFLFYAMRTEEASTAMALTSAYPLVTMLIALSLREEAFDLKRLAGALLIVAGMVVIQWPSKGAG